MKLNIAKYHLILLGLLVWCLASPTSVKAFTIWDVLSSDLQFSHSERGSDETMVTQWFAPVNKFTSIQESSSLSTDFVSRNISSRYVISNTSWVTVTSMVWLVSDWQWGWILKWWSEVDWEYFDFAIPSIAWFSRNFPDWESCLMDQVFFTFWSSVFYSSSCDRTLQVMAGWNVWIDYFIYVDPNINHNTNNLWLINYSKNYAWSTTVSNAVAWQLILWQIPPTQQTVLNIFNQNWYYSYTISDWGSQFRPTCPNIAGYVGSPCGPQWRSQGLVYSRDLTLRPLPEWSWWSVPVDQVDFSGNIIDFSQSVDYLGSCESRFENLRLYTEAYYKCQVSSDWDPAWEMLFYWWGLSWSITYTWDNAWCSRFAQLHNTFYLMYENNWAVPYYWDWSWPYDLQNLYDPYAPFINLAYSWIAYSIRIDENNNVVWLPTSNWVCQVAADNESNFSIDLGYLYDRLNILNIESNFESWYNSVLSWGLSCTNDSTVDHTIWNIVVTFAGALIILILFFLL